MSAGTERARVQAAEEAALWLVRLQDPAVTLAERNEFAAWLRFSPAHVQEFLNARATWEALSPQAMQGLPDEQTLFRELNSTGANVVVALDEQTTQPPLPGRRTTRRWLTAAAAAVLLSAGAAVYFAAWRSDPDHARYTTLVGEQSTYTLPDGSVLALNTGSHVRLDWSKHSRDVHLDSGEAVFDVARDPARPFRVWSGKTQVRALGTRFNVYRTDDAVTVTVLEGQVEVTDDTTNPVRLGAGEQTRVDKRTPMRPLRLAQPEKAVAWQTRRLEFDGTPLSQVIAEFNRYHSTPLVLEDPQLAGKRINGTFDAADRDSLVAFLEKFEGVKVDRRGGALFVGSH